MALLSTPAPFSNLWRAALSLYPVTSAKSLTSTHWLGLLMAASMQDHRDEWSHQHG